MTLFVIALISELYVCVGILLTCGKHLHDRIISVRGNPLAHKPSSSLPLFIEVSVQSQECERSCIFVIRVSILYLSIICFIGF
jgi:hypothetical protein